MRAGPGPGPHPGCSVPRTQTLKPHFRALLGAHIHTHRDHTDTCSAEAASRGDTPLQDRAMLPGPGAPGHRWGREEEWPGDADWGRERGGGRAREKRARESGEKPGEAGCGAEARDGVFCLPWEGLRRVQNLRAERDPADTLVHFTSEQENSSHFLMSPDPRALHLCKPTGTIHSPLPCCVGLAVCGRGGTVASLVTEGPPGRGEGPGD